MTNYTDARFTPSTRPDMGVVQSLRAFFQNYARFNGRAGRSEFWWAQRVFLLTTFLLAVAVSAAEIDHASRALMTTLSVISSMWVLVTLLPHLAAQVRRLHDTNRSGWFVLLHVIPVIGSIVLLVWWYGRSDPEGARFDAQTQPKLGN